ncbi:hypothetical protein ACFPT7_22040 [Acidicapsa dinghuensis]|uniref:Uncharacterized protein n=1 Tax=Acidicapsa dinghuensis TaxID=2218256 RepID=A0ABW1ELT5_9BACT|nr:hypothetical protein [Acidicapsa dinghuensis]
MRSKSMILWMTTALALLTLQLDLYSQTTCSYAAVNGNCRLELDRIDPMAPPTIYVRHGSKIQITVKVNSPLPFEHLSVDLKSAAEKVPVDQFASGFQNITSALGGLEIVTTPAGTNIAHIFGAPLCPRGTTDHPLSAATILDCQNTTSNQLKDALKFDVSVPDHLNFASWTYVRLCRVRSLFLPLDSSAVSPGAGLKACEDLTGSLSSPDVPKTPDALQTWKQDFDIGSEVLTKLKADDLKKILDNLDVDIAQSNKTTLSARDAAQISANQQALRVALGTYTSVQKKMSSLKEKVDLLGTRDEPSVFTIKDIQPSDKNDVVQTWDLNAANALSRVASAVKADKFGDKIGALLAALADAPTKQTVVEFKIQFTNEPHVEISGGLLVPFRPYHSFTVALPYTSAVAATGCTAGTGTSTTPPTNCPIVQQSLSTAIIPDVSLNFRLGPDWIVGKQRSAILFTVAPGYNSATTTAAFGVGLSYSYRSMVFSPLAVIDRDVHLTGGYVVNESAGTATAPTTTNYWRVSPSFGISMRVALGGGGK